MYKKLNNIPNITEITDITKLKRYDSIVKKYKKFFNKNIFYIIYFKSGKYKIHGYIIIPKKITKPIPGIIFCRGGDNALVVSHQEEPNFMVPGKFIFLYENFMSENTIFITTDHRGGKYSEGSPEYGKGDITDLKKLYEILSNYYYCNNSIGLIGISRGTFSALHLLTKKLSFTSVVLIGVLIDVKYRNYKYPYKLPAKAYNITINEYKKRQAINIINKLPKKPAYLIINGSNDWRTPVANSLVLTSRLINNNIHPKLIILPNGGHVPLEGAKYVREWIEKYTINLEKLPSPIVDKTSYGKPRIIKYPNIPI